MINQSGDYKMLGFRVWDYQKEKFLDSLSDLIDIHCDLDGTVRKMNLRDDRYQFDQLDEKKIYFNAINGSLQ